MEALRKRLANLGTNTTSKQEQQKEEEIINDSEQAQRKADRQEELLYNILHKIYVDNRFGHYRHPFCTWGCDHDDDAFYAMYDKAEIRLVMLRMILCNAVMCAMTLWLLSTSLMWIMFIRHDAIVIGGDSFT